MEKKVMKINVHAGHNPDGMVGSGGVGIIKESVENRKVTAEVIRQLRVLGHTVYDCTVNDGKNASDVLRKIVAKCNANEVDLDVSIHFNGGRNDYVGDDKTGGGEVFIYDADSEAAPYAEAIAAEIGKLGFNLRKDSTYPVAGVKVKSSFYVLKHTKAPAMLIECCFSDDADDIALYDYKSMADAIVRGLVGSTAEEQTPPAEDLTPDEGATEGTAGKLGRVQVGAYANPNNAKRMLENLHAAGFKDAIIVWS